MKNKKLVLGCVALILLILVLVGGYTFAKYRNTLSALIKIPVKRWCFNATTNGGADLSQLKLVTEDGSAIHPGSNGSFIIKVDATGSEYNICYRTSISEESLPNGMIFYLQGTEDQRHFSMTSLVEEIQGTLEVGKQQSAEYVVLWEWPEREDIEIADSSSLEYGFQISIAGEQI